MGTALLTDNAADVDIDTGNLNTGHGLQSGTDAVLGGAGRGADGVIVVDIDVNLDLDLILVENGQLDTFAPVDTGLAG